MRKTFVKLLLSGLMLLASATSALADPSQKVWMMQINPTVGDIEHNLGLIEAEYRKAVASGADIVMTPELALVGYPPRDLLRNRALMPRVNAALAHIRKLTETLKTKDGRSVTLVLGHPGEARETRGKELQNRTTVFNNGKVIFEHNKRLLPTYDIFDENRYFEAGKTTKSFSINGIRYAILNCEEGWFKDQQFGREIYENDPADDIRREVQAAHAQGEKLVILDTSASPWYYGKHSERKDIHADVVKRTGADGLVYNNMWGGNDQILFDGHSFVLGKGGAFLGELPAFREGHGVVAIPKELGSPIRLVNRGDFSKTPRPEDKVLYDAVVTGIRDYFRKTGLKGAVIGLSGGKDSGVIAQLAVDALGSENVIGVSMPSSISSDHSKNDARELAERLHIRYRVVPIAEAHELARKNLDIVPGSLTDENVQPRERGKILWTIANQNPGFTPLGTGNKDEYTQGYATIFGDVMPVNPIADANVAQVRVIGWEGNRRGIPVANATRVDDGKAGFFWNYTGGTKLTHDTIPSDTLTKPPSAELKPDQLDEDNLPPYDLMDQMVHDLENKDLGPEQFLNKWSNADEWKDFPDAYKKWPRTRLSQFLRTYEAVEIKRLLSAVTLKLSPRAFGPGRTHVIAKKFYGRGHNGEFEALANAPVDPALPAGENLKPASAQVVESILPHFRSSDRDIPAKVLFDEAVKKIPADLKHQLGGLSQEALLEGIHAAAASRPDLHLDQGVAENLFKVQRIYKLCQDFCSFSDENDNVPGLSRQDLDRLVKGLPSPPERPAEPNARARLARPAGEFDYPIHRSEQSVVKQISDNDHYNFKVGADYWGNGLLDTHEVTASLFSRGHENRPYLVSLGQEEVLDLVKNLRFTEEEIQYLKSHPDFKDVPAGYWDYLRNFKFKGTIRGLKPGTVAYADEPILEVTGNPVEVQVVETLIIPYINSLSNWATKAERIVRAAGGRVVVEGGTRRGASGFLSAKAAFVGGAAGTSNDRTARINGIPSFGSQNHFSIMIYPEEADGQAGFLRFFPDNGLLSDTNGPEKSVREAILAAGPNLPKIRLDSTLPGKDKAETARWARALLDKLGYPKTQILYSDGINEHEAAQLHAEKAPLDSMLVGTEMASPSDTSNLNVVYKLSQIRNKKTGEIFDPVKTAAGKLSLPGEHAVWRTYGSDGKWAGDTLTEIGEEGSAGARKLTVDLMIDGKDVYSRDPLKEQQSFVKEQVAHLPPDQLDLRAKKIQNAFVLSEKLKNRQALAVERAAGKLTPEMVLVIPGSFSPPTESHRKLIEGMRDLYSARYPQLKVVVVPSGDSTTNGKTHAFTANQRAAMLTRRLGGEEAMRAQNIEIYRGEIEGETKYTLDTMQAIERKYGSQTGGKTEFSLVLGEDILNGTRESNLISNWKNTKELFDRYNFIFHPRAGGTSDIAIDHRKEADFLRLLPKEVRANYASKGALRAVNPRTGRFVQIASVGAGDMSSTEIRNKFNAVDTVYLDIDTMKTFWEGMHGEPNGSLSVAGTREITPVVGSMKDIARADPNGKALTARDTHHPLELTDPDRFNPEFKIFDHVNGHAMKGGKGPTGDEPIPESDTFGADRQHRIPHLKESGGDLIQAEYDSDRYADLHRDPDVELIFEKSGGGINPRTGEREGSFTIANNPHFNQVLDRIAPKRYVVWGVCTDFCVDRSLQSILQRRQTGEKAEIIVITDAIAGVNPEWSADATRSWAGDGVKMMTAREYVARYKPELAALLPPARSTRLPGSSADCIRDALGHL